MPFFRLILQGIKFIWSDYELAAIYCSFCVYIYRIRRCQFCCRSYRTAIGPLVVLSTLKSCPEPLSLRLFKFANQFLKIWKTISITQGFSSLRRFIGVTFFRIFWCQNLWFSNWKYKWPFPWPMKKKCWWALKMLKITVKNDIFVWKTVIVVSWNFLMAEYIQWICIHLEFIYATHINRLFCR